MYFSPDTWDSDTVNQILPVSSGLSFDKVVSSLLSADDLFVIPLIGQPMADKATEIFEKQEEQRTDTERKLLRQLQVATLNLAFYYDFQELNLRITDQGFQRQTTENFTSAFKYQEDALIRNFRNKGLNALDNVLDILEQNTATFPEYLQSPAYLDTRKRIVRTAAEASEIYYINNSQIVFKRMQPILRELEDTNLPIILGAELNSQLWKAINEGRDAENIGDTTFEELRHRCAQYLVFKACAQLMRQTGSVTDRGLYFESVNSSGEGNEASSPAGASRAAQLAINMEQSATAYSNALTNFIQFYIPELFTGHEADTLRRDNTYKRTIWL